MSESHAGTHDGRSDSRVPSGSRPDATWRCEHLLAPRVPAQVELAAVRLDVLLRRLVRRVARAGREPEEERLVGRGGAQVLHEQDRLVGQVLGEVVALLRRARRLDEVVVVHELGVVLVGLAAHEPVEALEAAAERPLVARAAHRHLRRRREVPLADREGGVAVAHEDLGQEAVLVRDRGVVAGEAGGELDDAGHAVAVVVAPGEQARPRRRAQRGGVEVRVAVPLAGEPVEARRGDVGAVAAELRVADVVEQHDHDVRARPRAPTAPAATSPPTRRRSARRHPSNSGRGMLMRALWHRPCQFAAGTCRGSRS